MSNKKYRLLKDLPGKPAGILLSYSATLKMYQYEGCISVPMGDGYFVHGELPALVENNPDWFQEVVEPEPLFDAAKINERIAQLEIEERAFNAGRALWAKEFAPPSHQLRYETFEEYKIETHKAEKETTMKEVKKHFGIYTEADLDKARREGVSNGETMYSLEDVRKALHGEWGTGNAVENVLNRLRNYKK